MKKYQQLAEQLREQIASGIWQPGDRLPSLRDQVALSGMSFMTVSHAYQLLESQGHINRSTAIGLLRCATGNKNAESASHSSHSR